MSSDPELIPRPLQPAHPQTVPPAKTEAQYLLGHPVTQWILDSLCGQAVLLDGGGQLLAASEDALPALGLECPYPPEAQFPAPDEMDLPSRGYRASVLPVVVGGEEGQVCVFKDVRARIRQEELEAAFFLEIKDSVMALEAETARLEAQLGRPDEPLLLLRNLALCFREKLETRRQVLAPFRPGLLMEEAGLFKPVVVASESKAAVDGPSSRDERETVLVVDDSAMVLKLLALLLTRENYRVLTADSGTKGLALAQEQLPDVILLDAVMPDLNGFQVCGQLKADPRTRDIPVLFVTALRGEADEVFALKAGAIDFIPKPITPAIVVARVRNHLELKRSKDRLRTLSLMDGLTGIANRRQFDQCLEMEWQRAIRNGKPLSLVMGDVDYFKAYNDHFGHAEGDACLRKVAQAFKASLRRPGDLAARYGGEEFVCVLPDTDAVGARMVAEEIFAALHALALPHPESSAAKEVTVSLGVATVQPAQAGRLMALVEEADQKMYEAKRLGRNLLVQSPSE